MTVSRIGHIEFVVPDVDRSARFAQEALGLRETGRGGDSVYLTSNARRQQLVLTHGERHACAAIALDVTDPGALGELRGRVADAGLRVVADEPSHPGVADAFSFAIPEGPTIELCCGVAAVDHEPYDVLGVQPRKLGHVTVASADVPGVERALCEVLGMRVSDRIPGKLAWLRCNTDHHGIGLMPGVTGVNHYAFELEGWGAFEALADHLVRRDVRLVWGPGRHGPGANLFAYFEDADGSMVEVYADMLQVEDEAAYQPLDWPDAPTSLNRWGPGPDPAWFEYSTAYEPAPRRAVA
jgi:catechol-2,3-dioxygenase